MRSVLNSDVTNFDVSVSRVDTDRRRDRGGGNENVHDEAKSMFFLFSFGFDSNRFFSFLESYKGNLQSASSDFGNQLARRSGFRLGYWTTFVRARGTKYSLRLSRRTRYELFRLHHQRRGSAFLSRIQRTHCRKLIFLF